MFSAPRAMVGAELIDPDLLKALPKAWSRESAYPPCQEGWTPENPSYGNCWVTTAVVWDQLGGESKILTGDVFEPSNSEKALWHFQQELDGKRIDLTWHQFEEGAVMGETPHGTADWKSRIVACIDGDDSFVLRLNILLGNLKKHGYDMFTTGEDIAARFKAAHFDVFPAAQGPAVGAPGSAPAPGR